MEYDEKDLQQRADAVLAGGTGTFSKHWSRYPQGIAPFGIVSGEGTFVTGTNGETYLDTVGALGPNLLGYHHPVVTEAILRQVELGTSFSLIHPLEIETAELVRDLLPCAEMVRWCRNGTDATGMAVRLARAITGNADVVFIGYHGGAMDSYGSTTDKDDGILPGFKKYNYQYRWDDIDAVVQDFTDWQDLACIMVEVPALAWGTSDLVYQQGLRKLQTLAAHCRALFVLDEVVTFPRYGILGAQARYGVTPDLCTISKGIANGVPIAALVGKKAYMEYLNAGTVFASWTFAGEATGLAACKATLEVCRDTLALQHIREYGQQYGDQLQAMLQSYGLPATVYGNFARIAVRWQDIPGGATAAELRTLWLQEQAKRGVLYGIGVIFPNAAWDRTILKMLVDASHEVCAVMLDAITTGTVAERLACPVITDVMSVR